MHSGLTHSHVFVYQDHYKLALGQLNAARGMIDKVAQVRGGVAGL